MFSQKDRDDRDREERDRLAEKPAPPQVQLLCLCFALPCKRAPTAMAARPTYSTWATRLPQRRYLQPLRRLRRDGVLRCLRRAGCNIAVTLRMRACEGAFEGGGGFADFAGSGSGPVSDGFGDFVGLPLPLALALALILGPVGWRGTAASAPAAAATVPAGPQDNFKAEPKLWAS